MVLKRIKFKLRTIRNRLSDWFHKVRGVGIKSLNDYQSYEEYVSHQTQKTTDPKRIEKWLGEEWEIKVDGFKDVFERSQTYLADKEKALCLGARTGQEVKALRDLGKEAIGIDLVEFEPYTIKGDIHDLQFDDGSFDFLFTNIFDHALYPDKFCAEMERVCKPNGIIMIHLTLGSHLDDFSETLVFDPETVTKLFSRVDVVESRQIENKMDQMNWELLLRKA